MKYLVTWRSGSQEVVEGDTWQKALHAKNIPSHRWKLIRKIERHGPPPATISKQSVDTLAENELLLANAGAIK